MRDQAFEVEVTADRLDAAQPTLAAAIHRQNLAMARYPIFHWSIAVGVSAVVWPLVIRWIVPEAGPKVYFTLVATAIGFQLLLFAVIFRWFSPLSNPGLARYSARTIVRRTKKRAPFTVRYRVSDHEYYAANEKLGIHRHIRAGDAAVAYRTANVIMFFRWAAFSRPLAVVYLAGDEHRRAMDRFLEAGPIVVHDLSGGGTSGPTDTTGGAKMSNDRFNADPYAPTIAEPPRGGGCGRIAIGCGLVVSVALVLFALGIYLVWPGFLGYTVQHDLAELRDAVEQSNLEPPIRDELIDEFNALRLSIDDHNNFAFFQWLDIDREVKKILSDRVIDPREMTVLRTELGRMKKIQGIAVK
jgi:hypothetical protein